MSDKAKNILVLNAGSSSTKVSLYRFDQAANINQSVAAQPPIWQMEVDFPDGSIESIDWRKVLQDATAALVGADIIRPGSSSHVDSRIDYIDPYEGQALSDESVGADAISPDSSNPYGAIDIVGHRVVHGGEKYSSSVLIDADVKQDIKDCIKLAPLHNKNCLTLIETMEKLLPAGTKQVAVFDTAFHHTLPESVKLYPVPYAWYEKYGIRRFGFHGINYQYCTEQAAHLLKKEKSNLSLIVCHLGAGCSLAAIENGKSINTTMGFTPMDGLMMASRCGSIDPGIILYLLKNENISADQIDEALNKESGLKGISQSSDMKTIIEKMDSGNTDEKRLCKLAFTMFIEHLRASISAMRSSLKKLDALVFTAGIGEHSPLIREQVCKNLLELNLDEKSNQKIETDQNIAIAGSPTAILVIKAREDWEIARQCLGLCSK